MIQFIFKFNNLDEEVASTSFIACVVLFLLRLVIIYDKNGYIELSVNVLLSYLLSVITLPNHNPQTL